MCLPWISETAGVIDGPVFPEKMQANSRPYGPRTKKVKVAVEEFDGVAAVATDSDSESINIAESDADTDTAI